MSYEGFEEYLCKSGHYATFDAYSEAPKQCPCGEPWAYVHSVDETNGVVKGCPATRPAPKRKKGADDFWHEDHYGNRYATQRVRYRPGKEWIRLHSCSAR
jgi:hypothetical protein